MSYELYKQFKDMDRAVQADERVRLADLKATQEHNASAARAAELRNIPAFSDVNFERPQQAQPQVAQAPAPQDSPAAQAARFNQLRTQQPQYANQSEAETRGLARRKAPRPTVGADSLSRPSHWYQDQPAAEASRLAELRALNPVEPQANQTPAEDARISGKAPVGQVSGSGAAQYDKPTPYDPVIQQAAQQAGIDPVMFKRLIGSESSFNPTATSPRGESFGYGIAQIAASHGLSKEQMANPAVALPFAAKLLAGYIRQAGGDTREGVLRYKGAVSEAGRAAMGQVYDSKISGGAAPQQGQQAAQGQPQQAPQYQPNPQMRALVEQHIGELAARYQQIQRLAQNTLDPVKIEELRLAAMGIQSKVRDMRILGAVSMGYMSHADAAQMSPTVAAMLQKQAEAQSKAAGEIAVEQVKGANTMQNTQLRGLMEQEAAATAPVNLQAVTNQFNGNQSVFNPRTGAVTPFATALNSVLPR